MYRTYRTLLALVILAITVESINSVGYLPKITTASIHESLDKKGQNLTFVDDMELWSDFQKLLSYSSMEKPNTICVRGAWLIYSKPEFETPTANDVHVFSGNDNCVQPTNMSQIGAMQPIGPYKFKEQSITVFEKKYFGSFGLSYSPNGTEIKKFRKEWLPRLESLITVGKSSWTMVDYEGRTVCVKPKASSANNLICLAASMRKYKLPKNIRFVGVFANCGNENSLGFNVSFPTIELTDCIEFGSSKMENVIDDSPSLAVRADSGDRSRCNKQGSGDIPLKEDIVRKLTKLRFSHDFSSNEQLLWPERKEDIWKTEIFDTAFDIMIKTCPQEVVPTTYLELIREFTIYHLDKAWKTNKRNSSHDIKEFDKLALNLNECLAMTIQHGPVLRDRVLQAYMSIRSPKEFTEGIYAAFNPNPKFDIVIDSAWIVANFALGLCHHLNDYAVSFWAEYINVFRDLYFLPLMDRWQNPKEISAKAYGAILGGFGTDVQFKRLGFCASVVFDFSSNMLPFEKNFMK